MWIHCSERVRRATIFCRQVFFKLYLEGLLMMSVFFYVVHYPAIPIDGKMFFNFKITDSTYRPLTVFFHFETSGQSLQTPAYNVQLA
jgi:hypothetical protein